MLDAYQSDREARRLGRAVMRKRLLDVDRADFDSADFPRFNVRDFLRTIYADAGIEYDPAGLFDPS